MKYARTAKSEAARLAALPHHYVRGTSIEVHRVKHVVNGKARLVWMGPSGAVYPQRAVEVRRGQ